MAKKVLIISSSPRKGGNSDLLCDEFMKGAIEAVSYTHLAISTIIHTAVIVGLCRKQ